MKIEEIEHSTTYLEYYVLGFNLGVETLDSNNYNRKGFDSRESEMAFSKAEIWGENGGNVIEINEEILAAPSRSPHFGSSLVAETLPSEVVHPHAIMGG